MYCFNFCLIIVLYTVAALDESDVEQEWLKYQEKYGKSYRSPVQLQERCAIFKENLKKIKEHNILYDRGLSTHMEGINQFTDWTNKEFSNYVNRGLIDGPKLWGEIFQKIQDIKAPVSVDWRTKGAVTDVKNQRDCGSSWSFSATGAIEGQLGLKGNLVSLSEQNLIDCSKNSGCRGGAVNTAFDYARENGIETQFSYPYIASDGSCAADSSKVVTRISKFVIIPPNDEEALKQAIATAGPISVAIHATENLQRYKSGILDDSACKNDSLNHAVLIVGYGSERTKDYYLLKNSWGDQWGEGGYLRLSRNGNNTCGVASKASYPVL